MAFNNGFPVSYQPAQIYYPQFQQQPVNNQPTGLIWVQGENAAKSYPVAPNNTVALFDSENKVIYIKSVDASGMPSMKTLDYTIREMNNVQPAITQNNYVTRADFDALVERMAKLEKGEQGQ